MKINGNIRYLATFTVINILFYYAFSFINTSLDFRSWSEEYRAYYVFYGIIMGGLISLFQYISDNWNPWE